MQVLRGPPSTFSKVSAVINKSLLHAVAFAGYLLAGLLHLLCTFSPQPLCFPLTCSTAATGRLQNREVRAASSTFAEAAAIALSPSSPQQQGETPAHTGYCCFLLPQPLFLPEANRHALPGAESGAQQMTRFGKPDSGVVVPSSWI